jgi:hypothetical protein
MVIATARSRSLVSPRRALAATVEGSGHRGVGLRFVFEPTREVYGASIYGMNQQVHTFTRRERERANY